MEKFININGFENYQVSNLGNVKVKTKVRFSKNGLAIHVPEKVLKLNIKKSGYTEVTLISLEIRKSFSVHRLVALAFIPNPENKKEVNHINGIKNDNRIENLEWVTSKENTQHAIDTNLILQKGENCLLSKLTEKDILEIRLSKNKINDIASHFGVTRENISKIRNRKTWKHI